MKRSEVEENGGFGGQRPWPPRPVKTVKEKIARRRRWRLLDEEEKEKKTRR